MAVKKPKAIQKKVVEAPKLPFDIDVYQLLLHSRQLHLTGEISYKVTQPIINQIMALQLISDDPIVLWINSPGGALSDGFALVDTIQLSKVPIFTVIRGWACSMGAIISVAGHRRYMTANSMWMAHDVSTGSYDYGTKVIERVEQGVKHWQKQTFDFWANHSKLTPKDLEMARHGELWLTPEQCLDKGVVEKVF